MDNFINEILIAIMLIVCLTPMLYEYYRKDENDNNEKDGDNVKK